jgi:hypothetical protein
MAEFRYSGTTLRKIKYCHEEMRVNMREACYYPKHKVEL